MDTRTAVGVSTAERIVLRETRNFLKSLGGGVSEPALYKNPAVTLVYY